MRRVTAVNAWLFGVRDTDERSLGHPAQARECVRMLPEWGRAAVQAISWRD
jgi:hypothetical protein